MLHHHIEPVRVQGFLVLPDLVVEDADAAPQRRVALVPAIYHIILYYIILYYIILYYIIQNYITYACVQLCGMVTRPAVELPRASSVSIFINTYMYYVPSMTI
jgi:hypothetical protein